MEEQDRVKHYEILSRIGEGGMGVVYRVRDTRLGRTVALKMLHPQLAKDTERIRRFEREARIVSGLSHPGIATLYDFDHEGDTAFLTMELVEGPTLRELLKSGPLETDRILKCGVQVAETLAAAHQEGVIHRDLKPENIMLAASGYYKILDFGVARFDELPQPEVASDTKSPTRTWATAAGGLVGTVAYMSPEQALGRAVDARSDIFSFGSLFYELITGKPSFSGVNTIATAQKICGDEPDPIRPLRPDIPSGLELVVNKCLAKKPSERYQAAEELAADLRILRLDSLSGTRRLSDLRAYRSLGSKWWRWSIASVSVAALIAAGIFVGSKFLNRPATGRGVAETAIPAQPAATSAAKPRIIVAFFENNSSDEESAWLSRGLAEMITTNLARSDDLEVIATQRIYDLLAVAGQGERGVMDRSTAPELARWAGADIVIGGSVFKIGESYRIDAQAYDTTSGTIIAAHKVEGAELFKMVDELTAGLRADLSVSAIEEKGVDVVTTSSEEAFRHYAKGKQFHENLMFDEAASEFRWSLEADDGFALAQLRLAMSLLSAGDEEAALPLIDKAAAQAERMPNAEHLMTRALHAFYRERDFETGSEYLEQLARQYPGERDTNIVWARALTDLGNRPLRATRRLREAIERDPGNLQAIAALVEQLSDLGEVQAARAILDEAIQRNPQAAAPLAKVIE
jgi:serine/threonine protein kinase/tetratricopeptide (TPR) repeat protein